MLSITLIVAEALVDDIVITPGFLVCEFIKTRYVSPLVWVLRNRHALDSLAFSFLTKELDFLEVEPSRLINT